MGHFLICIFLNEIDLHNGVIIDTSIKQLLIYLDESWEQRKSFMEKVNKWLYIIDGEAEDDVNTFLSADHTLDEYIRYVTKYDKISSDIRKVINPTETIGIFTIDFTDIIEMLYNQAKQFRDAIVAKLEFTYTDIGKKYTNFFI